MHGSRTQIPLPKPALLSAVLALALAGCPGGASPEPGHPGQVGTTAASQSTVTLPEPSAPSGPVVAPTAPPTAPVPVPTGPETSGAYRMDGIAIGDRFEDVVAKDVYANPCDIDPIEKRTARIALYAGKECRGQTFPDRTTVIVVYDYVDRQPKAGRIQAIIWMGGSYFHGRSNFPLRVGEPASRATAALGAPVSTFSLPSREVTLTFSRHKDNVTSISEGGKLVGFAVGAMPESKDAEHYRGLAKVYRRYVR